MKTPLVIVIAVAALFGNGAKMTARAESALAVTPFSGEYTIQEIGIVSTEHSRYKPVIVAFDDAGTFAVNADVWGSVFHIRGIPVQSPSLFELPSSFKQEYRIAARNDLGHVVGELNSRVFMWKSGAPQILPFIGGKDSLSNAKANDVNDKGQIVGESLMESAASRGQYSSATLWEGEQAFELEVAAGFLGSHALAISNSGQIVGDIGERAWCEAKIQSRTVDKQASPIVRGRW